MSMIRRAKQTQPWGLSGYVCQACRRELGVARHQQRRWQSSASSAAEPANARDEPSADITHDGQTGAKNGERGMRRLTRRERVGARKAARIATKAKATIPTPGGGDGNPVRYIASRAPGHARRDGEIDNDTAVPGPKDAQRLEGGHRTPETTGPPSTPSQRNRDATKDDAFESIVSQLMRENLAIIRDLGKGPRSTDERRATRSDVHHAARSPTAVDEDEKADRSSVIRGQKKKKKVTPLERHSEPWGVGSLSDYVLEKRASWESLRKADKISPDRLARRKVTLQPWGVAPPVDVPGFANSPADLDDVHARSGSPVHEAALQIPAVSSADSGRREVSEASGLDPLTQEVVVQDGVEGESGATTPPQVLPAIQSLLAQTDGGTGEILKEVTKRDASEDTGNGFTAELLKDKPNSDSKPKKPKSAPAKGGRKRRVQSVSKQSSGGDEPVVRRPRSKKNSDEDNHAEEEEHKPLWMVMDLMETMAGKSLEAPPAQNPLENNEQTQTLLSVMSAPEPTNVTAIQPNDLHITPLNVPQPPVPRLEYGLDRVLFNSGVYQLQDSHSRVYNFDPYLQKIMPVIEFDFNALKQYKTSSQDTALSTLAEKHAKKYIGSTSSMTGTLAHFHYLLSDFRELNLSMLSRGFSDKTATFTPINRAPNAIFLRWKNGSYAIDADKEYDGANVLMLLGKSMEKLLTLPTSEYERYRKSDPRSVSEEERTAPEAFEYTTMGDFLMRSQLDAYDERLPGTGTFDLKTRAVVSVRMDAEDFQPMTGYEIQGLHGRFESYEREYYDMIRSTMLKYMLQVRMGRMDGIFVAYHNIERIFGFQYIPVPELDAAIHGQFDRCLGDQEFKASLDLLNKVLNRATEKFPERSLRLHFETKEEKLVGSPTTVMWIFAEPMADDAIDEIQDSGKAKVAEFERTMMGITEDAEGDAEATAESEPAGPTSAIAADDGSVGAPSDEQVASGEEGTAAAHASSVYTKSDSNADVEFVESIGTSASGATKPLFAASLIVKSRVNGTQTQRPARLRPEDDWKVEYVLQEWEASDDMWTRYEQLRARRREAFEKCSADEDGARVAAVGGETEAEEGASSSSSSTKKNKKKKSGGDGYLDFLRQISDKGREFRERMDRLDAGRASVVVGEPVYAPAVTAVARGPAEAIEDVDEYMHWLYEEDKRE